MDKKSMERLMNGQELKALQNKLDREIKKQLNEVEELLKIYLAAMLDKTHQQLIRGTISLPEYYRDTQMLANCAEKLREEDI